MVQTSAPAQIKTADAAVKPLTGGAVYTEPAGAPHFALTAARPPPSASPVWVQRYQFHRGRLVELIVMMQFSNKQGISYGFFSHDP